MNRNDSNSLPMKNATAFGNPTPVGIAQMQTPISHSQTNRGHLLSQQPHLQSGIHFPGHFQLSEPQAQAQTASGNLQNSASKNNAGGLTSPAISTPATAVNSVKRTPSYKPPSRTSGSSSGGQGQGGTASPLKTMELTPAVRRKKQKISEKKIPDKVAISFPESTFYAQMLELESRINAVLTRKKIAILESIKHPLHIQKILRIYVFNTHANQVGAPPQITSAEPPSWSLKITGRILEGEIDPAILGLQHISSYSYPKFSSFFKKITVYLDQNLYPDNHVVLWESSRSAAAHEGFEVKRKGDSEFTAMVRLEMNFVPEKFKLAPALQEVLGIEVETRPRIISALWHYIKTRKLQIPGDTSSFMCDPPLRKVFGEEKLKFVAVIQKITEHLTLLKPIHLEHKIKLSGNSPVGNTCYDVLVDVPFALEEEMPRFLSTIEKNKEIEAFNGVISTANHELHEYCQRRDFFLAFSQSPAEFINAFLASQARDLKLLGTDTNRDKEREHQSQFYDQPWIEDAVYKYLNRKLTTSNPSGSK
ncbi:hypothetical protein M9H77_37035 [Catharanthus roseus]|uniref:Uncharacterized protein n=1 Tax=Catharanthus roseus TaxID=4058 RepID=A0ACB9ZUC9_CATRO|nr:hypothetical protein M9H77_37035 [Catharanthus roseus]